MKGLRFDHFIVGRGFCGLAYYGCRWCVEYKGKKYHITREARGYTHYDVKPCDGSCEKGKEDLPSDVENAFLEKVKGV